jgi:tetratricopeptide (TPR) repeat protein
LIAVLAAAGQLPAATNVVVRDASATTATSAPNDPVEKEFKQLMADDDAAQAEVDAWLRENEKFAAAGSGLPSAELNRRVRERLVPVRTAYEDFIRRYPGHARARIAYGSFLNDLHEDEAAQEQWEKALVLDPKNPATYNNLANLYGQVGLLKKAFECYAKAIELNPREPVYYHNFGTTVFLFRKDAREFYGITEPQVFDKALELYRQALKLDPRNFPLASDVAQTYYGIRPQRTDEALKAWTNTLAIAESEIERESVYLHLARVKLMAGRFAEARAHLNCVTNETYNELKARLTHNLNAQDVSPK